MAKDIFHDLVRSGLEKEGWIITDDPYRIELDKTNFQKFLSYRLVLKTIEPQRILFLAIPLDAYEEFFQSTFAQLAINEYQLKLIIYDSEQGGLTKWIN